MKANYKSSFLTWTEMSMPKEKEFEEIQIIIKTKKSPVTASDFKKKKNKITI
jgi:hypothetical protein